MPQAVRAPEEATDLVEPAGCASKAKHTDAAMLAARRLEGHLELAAARQVENMRTSRVFT